MNLFKWMKNFFKISNFEKNTQLLINNLDVIFGNNEPKESIYHYTNFYALKGILESKRLWQTHHKYLNDPSEIEHGKNVLINAINMYVNQNDIKFRMTKMVDDLINSYHNYLISFCDKEDYLPAWRYYGDDGAGYSIGFKREFFTTKDKEHINAERRMTFYKVEYSKNPNIPEKIKLSFIRADDILPNWQNDEISIVAPILISRFITELPRFKNVDYIDENEWRICLPRIIIDNKWHPYEFPTNDLFHTQLNSQQTSPPFLKKLNTSIPRINALEFKFSDIDRIFIGPRLDYSMASQAITKILSDAGASKADISNIELLPSKKVYQ